MSEIFDDILIQYYHMCMVCGQDQRRKQNPNRACAQDDLKLRKEMIFPKESIETMHQIGSGQFGAVFKGTFNHGNAR